MKYIVQDRSEDGFWDERPVRFWKLQDAILEACADQKVQIVAVPSGEVVWRSQRKNGT